MNHDEHSNSEPLIRQQLGRMRISGPTQPSSSQLLALNDAHSDLAEIEILLHSSIIRAERAVSNDNMDDGIISAIDSWEKVLDAFRALGYTPGSNCGWKLLGLAKEEGPAPTLEQIERRAHLTLLLTSIHSTAVW